MNNAPDFPLLLSADSRVAVALRVIKTALSEDIPRRIRAAGGDPLSALPPSSPVLKHGFFYDARVCLLMVQAHCDRLTHALERTEIRSVCRTLLRTRDLWAHQQGLTQPQATAFLREGAILLSTLGADPEAQVLLQLCSKPEASLHEDLRRHIRAVPARRTYTYSSLVSALHLVDMPFDAARLSTVLVWDAAVSALTGLPELARRIVLAPQDTPDPGDTGLPGRSFWWLFDLAASTAPEIRRAAYREYLATLDEDFTDA